MLATLQGLMHSNRLRGRGGIYSVCSANRCVLEAAMIQAQQDGTLVCIESTSNQVNQFGGYMGQTPAEFAAFVKCVSTETRFPSERIILGGDHLGPHVWRSAPGRSAMGKAAQLVRDCVHAGYAKIHLDASMRCSDDPGGSGTAPGEEVVAARSAELCSAAEDAWADLPPGSQAPLYVIGTEVPPPGGAQADGPGGMNITRAADVERSVGLTREAFFARGLGPAWERVIAVVVQPGVEFSDSRISEYDRGRARELKEYVERNRDLVFEAHSTDYQPARALAQLVEDHFAILKVGPWLTFTFREVVFALAAMEAEWLAGRKGVAFSGVREALDRAMLREPGHWVSYYRGSDANLSFARKYSYSDRSRYYWSVPEVQQALQTLFANLTRDPVPLNLLSQYLPAQYLKVREQGLPNKPADLIRDRIQEVLKIYAAACAL